MMIFWSLTPAMGRWQWLATSLLLTAGALSSAPAAMAQAVATLKPNTCQRHPKPPPQVKHLSASCDRPLTVAEPLFAEPLFEALPFNEPLSEELSLAELDADIGARSAPAPTVTAPTADSTATSPPVLTAESPPPLVIAENLPPSGGQAVDVDPAIIDSSPVLQRWLEAVPDVAIDIQHDPAFRTRVRLGYAEFPSADNTGGLYVGVQDVFVGQTPLTLSAEYAVNRRGDRQLIGADAQYYLLPLGWYGNVAPVVGYRSIETSTFDSDGVNLGFRIILVPSRGGAADLSFTQSWVAPGTDQEVGLSTFSAGYAIAEDIRIGTDIQTQNAGDRQESRVIFLVEWMP
ncbi:MAG: hypothetical protein AAF773_23790 [Cyanobacteria bacterium P01_D01_bin.115]